MRMSMGWGIQNTQQKKTHFVNASNPESPSDNIVQSPSKTGSFSFPLSPFFLLVLSS
jgi:hypothetical protein